MSQKIQDARKNSGNLHSRDGRVNVALASLLAATAFALGVFVARTQTESAAGEIQESPAAKSESIAEFVLAEEGWANSLAAREAIDSISNRDLQKLLSNVDYISRFLQTHPEMPPAEQAHAQYVISLMAWLANEHRTGEAFSAAAADGQVQIASLNPSGENCLLAARACNSYCCALVKNGQRDPGLEQAQLAVEWAGKGLSPDTPEMISELCLLHQMFGLRSIAILKAEQGSSGISEAKRSLELAEQIYQHAESHGFYQWSHPTLVIDAQQLVGFLQGEKGLTEESLATYQQTIIRLDQIQEDLSAMGVRDAMRIRKGSYDQKREWLTQAVASRLANHIPFIDRRWNQTLHPDYLLKGTMQLESTNQSAIAMVWSDQYGCQKVQIEALAELVGTVPVILLTDDESIQRLAQSALENAGIDTQQIRFLQLPASSVWIRDFGPMTMTTTSGQNVLIDALYGNQIEHIRGVDERIPLQIARRLKLPVMQLPVCVQGGDILANGQGLCLVSNRIFARNQQLGTSQPQIEEQLNRIVGSDGKLVFIDPLQGEPTGHLDWFVTFPKPDTVVIGEYADKADPNCQPLNDLADQLAGMPTKSGPLKVQRIPMPPRQKDWFGGTFTNVIYANGKLLIPSWTGAEQELAKAIAIYQKQLPDWEIIPINSDTLGRTQGALHCFSLNLPFEKQTSP